MENESSWPLVTPRWPYFPVDDHGLSSNQLLTWKRSNKLGMLIVLVAIKFLPVRLYLLSSSVIVFLFAVLLPFPTAFSLLASLPALYPAVDYFWSAWIISGGSWAQGQRKWSKFKKTTTQNRDIKSLLIISYATLCPLPVRVYLQMVFQTSVWTHIHI